jgi:hypothetical protein
MTIESWNSYPKVYALGHRSIQEILEGDVVVQEKIDGSQISFGRFDGVLKIRSKNKEMIVEAPEKMFGKAVETISGLDLVDGWTYRGEYLQKPKHNTLTYDRVPKDHIILFDITTGLEFYADFDFVAHEAERLGLESVHTFYYGPVTEKAELVDFLDKESCLGGPKIEGFVIKNYNRFNIQDGKPLFGKYVSEAFKEKHTKEWKTTDPGRKDIIAQIIEDYSIDARYQKAVQHLRDSGELKGDPRDIGPLIKEVGLDVDTECAHEIAMRLYNHFKKDILRGVTSGVPNWYKGELLASQFTETTDARNNVELGVDRL